MEAVKNIQQYWRNMEMNLKDYGLTLEGGSSDGAGILARVTAVYKERYEIVCKYGETFARLKAKEYYNGAEDFPTAGDFVQINYIPNGDSQIIHTLPRKTLFSRRDPTPGRGEQAVAANFDYVFILQSLNNNFNGKRLERYLTLAWQSGAIPVIVLTKADLTENYNPYLQTVEDIAPGVDVYVISSKSGFGIEGLSRYIQPGKTVVFLGSSGVGKSSLVNVLAGEEIMPVSEIRGKDSRGRHTTTRRQLIMLKSGAMVIDTPGMRELGMWDVSVGIHDAFEDVEKFLGECRFSDCRHQSEPGCAIREAIARGELSPERWESYRKLKSEAKYSDDKTAYLREKQQWHKTLAKQTRSRKNRGKRDDLF